MMPDTFQKRLDDDAATINARLDALLIGGPTPAEARLVDAMRHAALAGGKRIRPFLVMETTRLFGGDIEAAVRVGTALECLHTYSLVHDDLPAMDNDDLRRGQPTVHVAFDEATAILAGDALLTTAFEIIADTTTHPDGTVRAALMHELAVAAGYRGMVGGQAMDLAAETNPVGSALGVIAIQAKKTGALMRFACRAGAILGAADRVERAAVSLYADHLGLAFQIADDILDVVSSAHAMGKRTGKDRTAGKATFVDLDGREGARDRLRHEVKAAISALGDLKGDTSVLAATAQFVMTRQI